MAETETGRGVEDGGGADEKEEGAPEGVRALDHTADVGIVVEAADLADLFRRTALGSLWMAVGEAGSGDETQSRGTPESADGPESGDETGPGRGHRRDGERREIELQAEGLDGLLRSWSREVLYWQEVEGFLVHEVSAVEIDGEGSPVRLRAEVLGGPAPRHPLREIKGVTWHGLRVERAEGDAGWRAHVIFDV